MTRIDARQMNSKLFMTLLCMSFLWIGSQIPLYMFGSVLPLIYQDIGGVDRYTWFVIGYLIPNAALCPFVGALSDLFGRRNVAIVGQVTLIVGPIITATADTMNIAIGRETAPPGQHVTNNNQLDKSFLASALVSTNSSRLRVLVNQYLLRTAASTWDWWFSPSSRFAPLFSTLR
jgi:MFS family permease